MAAVIRERTDPGHASEMDGPKVIRTPDLPVISRALQPG